MKSLLIAAAAAAIGFAAPVTTAAADDSGIDPNWVVNTGGGSIGQPWHGPSGHHPHVRPPHNGLSFGFYFGHPGVYYHHPRPRPRIRLTHAHISWCYNRWRTYRHEDNSFMSTHGRRLCWSPYLRHDGRE
jgi:BA14K-like protein